MLVRWELRTIEISTLKYWIGYMKNNIIKITLLNFFKVYFIIEIIVFIIMYLTGLITPITIFLGLMSGYIVVLVFLKILLDNGYK